MNNSSAYNNILLKTVQPQAAQIPAPKRNYQDEQQDSVSFQQSLRDVHENVREQDARAAKPVAKKVAAIDNRKPANEVEKKPAAPSRDVDENSDRDQDVGNAGAAPDTNENCASSQSSSKNSPDQESAQKDTNKKLPADDSATANAALINPLAVAQPLTSPVPSVEAASTVTPTVANPNTIAGAAVVSGAAANADQTDAVETSTFVKELGLTNQKSSTTTKDQVPTTNTSDKTLTPIVSDVDASSAAQELAADLLVPQAPADKAPDVVADGEVTPLVMGVRANSPLGSTSSASTADVSDEEMLSGLAAKLGSELPTKATVTAKGGDLAATPERSSPEPTIDLKSAFEKTLQNLAHPETAVRDDNSSATSTAQATNSVSSSTTNVLESMARFNDAQTPAARSFVVQTAVPVPVGQPQWSQAVGEKVLWLAAQNVSAAEIHLNPENLGPMQVKVSVNQDQTTINFTSHHAVVREVLDQNLGRLRDMFSEQGLNLVNVDVSDKSFNRQQGDTKEQQGQTANNDVIAEEEPQVAVSLIKQQRLVDHYA